MWSFLPYRNSPPHLFLLGWMVAVCWGLLSGPAYGQENPPKDLPDVLRGAIRPDAFYFVDDQGNRVMFPSMSLEEIDRLKKEDLGYVQRVKPYTINSISIEGTADNETAELTIITKISVAGAPGQWIEIPLKMEGFHQRGPADVVGAENYKVDTAEDGGVVLWVKTAQPREVELRMRRVACRVLADVGQGIRFRLPSAPTEVTLDVRDAELSASVVGRGDEIVRTSTANPGETRVNVECSGGTFVLSWRVRDGRRESDQVLEVDSRMRVVWTDPQSPASVVVEVDVNNRRGGSLGPFQIVVPDSADLIEPMQSSSVAQLSARDPKTGIIQVTPDDTEPLSRLKITLEYRLPSGDYRSENPLVLLPIDVPAAVRQGGEIEIRTDRNYRLRWKQQPNVRSIWRASTSDPVEVRAYSFQFDRSAIELPVWLTAKQQRLRVEPEYSVRVGKSTATLEARITATGTIIEGVPLVVDAAGWQTVAVEDLETGRSVDDPLGDSGEGLELELGELTQSGGSSVGVLWKAVRPLVSDEGDADTSGNSTVRFELPTISLPDDRAVIVSQGALSVGANTGYALVPDLEASQGLTLLPNDLGLASSGVGSSMRSTSVPGAPGADEMVSRFRVLNVGLTPVYQGYLTERRPEANIDAKIDIALDGEVIRIINDWVVKPRGRLQGQLPINIPKLTDLETSVSTDNGKKERNLVTVAGEDWIVRVDGQPGFLRNDLNGRWTLFSERLAGDTCRVQLEAIVSVAGKASEAIGGEPVESGSESESLKDSETEGIGDTMLVVALPKPALTGATLGRTSPVSVAAPADLQVLLGAEQVEVSSDEPYNAFSDSQLLINLQKRKELEASPLVLNQALMRTELGRFRRYDRLLCQVSGGSGSFRIDFTPENASSLLAGDGERVIRIWVDGTEILNFQRFPTGLEILLDATAAKHLVDIQIWRPRTTAGMMATISPELRLPISSGKTYWDVVMAADRHLIWSSPGASELMLWRYENLFVHRVPTRSYSDLLAWIGGPAPTDSQAGNRYLLVTADPGSLRIAEAGRPLLWFSIGGTVLAISVLLFYAPALRHPLLAVAGGVGVGGMAWLVPDLAVIAGQLMIFAMLLIAIMLGIRALLSRRTRPTVLGGIPEGSSIRSVGVRRSGLSGPDAGMNEAKSKRGISDTIGSGSAAGVQS